MAEETAYIMVGHGLENPSNPASPNIVPHGCTLVVEVHSGELGYYSGIEHLYRIISYKNKKIFLDPIGNYKELVSLTNNTEQSFAIYKAGDVYPNFYYSLFSYHKMPDTSIFYAEECGVLKYPFNYIKTRYGYLDRERVPITASSDIITDLYRMSVLPTEKEIDKFMKDNNYLTINSVLESYTNPETGKSFSSITYISQEELFDELGPGVYYNFVCRATTDSVRIKAESYQAKHNEVNPLSYHMINGPQKSIKLNPLYRNSNINKTLYPVINHVKPLRVQPGYHTNFKPAFKRSNRPNFNPNYKYVEPNYTKRVNYQQLLKSFLNKQESLPNKSNYATSKKINAFFKSRKKHKFFIPEVRQLIEEAEWHRKPYIGKLDFNTLNTIETVDSEIATIIQKKSNLIKNTLISNELKKEKLIKYDNLLKAYNNEKVSIPIRNKIFELKGKISIINDNINMDDSTKIQQLEILNKELNEQEALLISLNSLKNTASNSYTWKKLKNKNGQFIKNNKGHFKWGKYTVKNKNNSPLPPGWTEYSNANGTWYVPEVGESTWNRPKSPLPAGWTEYSNTNGTWYVSEFGESTWNRPTKNAKERVIETMPNTRRSSLYGMYTQPRNFSLKNLANIGIHPYIAPPVVVEELPSLNIVLDPSIKLLNSDARGTLPVGWKYYLNKGQKLYISPTGKIYDKRPIIKISKVNSIGQLPPGWSYITDGYKSWYRRDKDGKIQQHRPG